MYEITDQIYREDHANLESGIDCRKTKLTRGKYKKRHIPDGCTITITIFDSHNATQPHP